MKSAGGGWPGLLLDLFLGGLLLKPFVVVGDFLPVVVFPVVVIDLFQVTGPDGNAEMDPQHQEKIWQSLADVFLGKVQVSELFSR